MLRLTLPQNSQLIKAITSRKLHEPNKAKQTPAMDASRKHVGDSAEPAASARQAFTEFTQPKHRSGGRHTALIYFPRLAIRFVVAPAMELFARVACELDSQARSHGEEVR